MKKMKRFSVLLALVLVLGGLAAPQAFAAAPHPAEPAQASPRMEVTEWHFRIYNGVPQKRLWSLTNGRWLTEWTDIN